MYIYLICSDQGKWEQVSRRGGGCRTNEGQVELIRAEQAIQAGGKTQRQEGGDLKEKEEEKTTGSTKHGFMNETRKKMIKTSYMHVYMFLLKAHVASKAFHQNP